MWNLYESFDGGFTFELLRTFQSEILAGIHARALRSMGGITTVVYVPYKRMERGR